MTILNTEHLQELKTPCYLYDLDLLDRTLIQLKKASDQFGYRVHYAMKANINDTVLNKISSYGLGADCVSGAEIEKGQSIRIFIRSYCFCRSW